MIRIIRISCLAVQQIAPGNHSPKAMRWKNLFEEKTGFHLGARFLWDVKAQALSAWAIRRHVA